MNSEKNIQSIGGYFYIALYCIINATSFVFISNINKTHNELISMVMVFSYATILFSLANITHFRSLLNKIVGNFKIVALMNLATLLNWYGSFFSLNYIDPATALCINISMAPITTFFILTPISKIKQNLHVLCAIVFILFGMLLMTHEKLSAETVSHTHYLLGILISVLGGIAGGFVGIYSEKMNKAGFSVTQILATRFYLLIGVSIVLIFLLIPTINLTVANFNWKFYLLSSLLIVMAPLFMYQKAIKSLGPLVVSIYIPFTPILTYFLQTLTGEYKFHMVSMVLLLIVCFSVIGFLQMRKKITPVTIQKLPTGEDR